MWGLFFLGWGWDAENDGAAGVVGVGHDDGGELLNLGAGLGVFGADEFLEFGEFLVHRAEPMGTFGEFYVHKFLVAPGFGMQFPFQGFLLLTPLAHPEDRALSPPG